MLSPVEAEITRQLILCLIWPDNLRGPLAAAGLTAQSSMLSCRGRGSGEGGMKEAVSCQLGGKFLGEL